MPRTAARRPDDSDDDDHDGNGLPYNLQHHSGGGGGGGFAGVVVTSLRGGTTLVQEGLTAVEVGALGGSGKFKVVHDKCSDRALSGRLGGYTTSLRLVDDTANDLIDEATGLIEKGEAGKESIVHHHSPPLIQWIFPALLCAVTYALYNIFIKKGSASIHPILGGVILQFVAAFWGMLLLGYLYCRGKGSEIHCDKWGLIWASVAGLWVGSAEMLSFTVSGMGVPATQSIPIIIGGSVLFGAVLGALMLGEIMVWHGWSGVALLTIGIGLVATDPGDKVEEGGGGSDVQEEPPLYIWIGPALICAMSYALYNISIKKGSATINPVLGGVVLQLVAALFGTCLLCGIFIDEAAEGGSMMVDKTGIIWSCAAGVAVGTCELLSFGISGMGVQATQFIPINIGGSVMFGAVLGIFMLGETLEWQGWTGVVLLVTGLSLVATDPGN